MIASWSTDRCTPGRVPRSADRSERSKWTMTAFSDPGTTIAERDPALNVTAEGGGKGTVPYLLRQKLGQSPTPWRCQRRPLGAAAAGMKFAAFFIDRPVFAAVISIVTVIVGAMAVFRLPISQYPGNRPADGDRDRDLSRRECQDRGRTVATPIEEQVNGVEGMMYMSSQCTNDGTMVLTVTFKLGTNLDIAQVQVQNRVAIAQPQLPPEVQRQGITVKKASPDITLGMAHLLARRQPRPALREQLRDAADQGRACPTAGRGRHDDLRRARLLDAAVAEPGATGVAEHDRRRCDRGGAGAERAGGGRHRRRPAADARHGAVPIHRQCAGPAHRAEQFAEIIVKTGADGSVTRVKDVARVELGRRRLHHEHAITMACRPSASACSSCPAPTRSRRRTPSTRKWRN